MKLFYEIFKVEILIRPSLPTSEAVHKVRHARGGGGPRRCDSLWQRGGGSRACDVTLINFLSYLWNMKFQVMF